jgi:hypothetical protein
MPRYVILRHELPPGNERRSHYDVMFDVGEALWTWAVDRPPDVVPAQPALRLADHRRDYLTYEGPVSGNRGEVTRWDEGDFEVVRDDGEALVFGVQGRRLRGTIQIAADGRFSYAPGTWQAPATPKSPWPRRRPFP